MPDERKFPKVLVIGDLMEDRYKFCKAIKICSEAPAPVLHVVMERNTDGGAALVANQLKALIGVDNVKVLLGSSSVKLRIFADRHLICRIDNDSTVKSDPAFMIGAIEREAEDVDLIVCSDYNKGTFEYQVVNAVINTGKPVFVDTKGKWMWWKGAQFIFPNEEEHRDIRTGGWNVVRKLGDQGCQVNGLDIPTKPQQVYDVTGAGDVFLAAFVTQYLRNPENLLDCGRFANVVAGISVRNLGTYVVSWGDIQSDGGAAALLPESTMSS